MIGVGTWEMKDKDVLYDVLDAALAAGYRLIDTAAVYGNEAFIGEALVRLLPKHGLKREDIFITSKLATRDQGAAKARAGALQSLSNLQTEYLDLYLVHFPGVEGIPSDDPRIKELRKESWLELEKLHREGKLRAIGVSNYLVRHLEEMDSYATVTPAVNQCEFHPHLIPEDVVELCRRRGIHFQAYSSLGTAANKAKLFAEPIVQQLAVKYACGPARLLLAWALNQGVSVLPKTSSPAHVKDNFSALEIKLDQADIDALSALGKGQRYCWDPTKVI